MSDDAADLEQLRREVAYYKRQVAELAGENLRLDYTLPALRHELRQKRDGFALLSQLQQSITAHNDISSIFKLTVPAINSTLGMDRTVVLSPADQQHVYRPTHWSGFLEEFAAGFTELSIELPPAFARGDGLLLVNRSTPRTELIEELHRSFDLPYFLAVSVPGEDSVIGVIFSGRLKEAAPMFPPLDRGDADTFRAIAGLITATVRSMRVAVLEETNRLKTEFFANISHEFRTPITLTLGLVEQALNGVHGELEPSLRERLELVSRNQARLHGLVNQILDLAKLEAGQMTMRAVRVADLNRFIEDRAESFRAAAAKPDVSFRLSLDPRVAGAGLYVDRDKLDKLLFNLLSNAYKFTRQGSIEVSTEIRDGSFRLTVSDTGIGIKEDQIPFIFDRFRQADASESREFGGTGIGLALVKEVAELHGGDVLAYSQLGRGSSFQVTIPLGSAHLDPSSVVEIDEEEWDAASGIPPAVAVAESHHDAQDVDELNTEAEESRNPDRPVLLYAEDNADLRRYVRSLLRPHYNVFIAADGEDGLEKVRQYAPDLVITDFMMPRVSGREFLQQIRGDPDLRHLPVIFLTARAGTGARIESLDAGADDYLSKPFDQGELLARIKNMLRARQQERELSELNRRLAARVDEQMQELIRSGELRRFLPPSVVSSLLSGKLQPDAAFERRKITVLSCTISAFDRMSEQLEPEDLASILDEFIREMTAIVIRHGGTVESISGGSFLVLFGAPEELAVEEQAGAAVRAAREMHARFVEVQQSWTRYGAPKTQIQIGVNTGYCTVGVFGSDLLSSYTAVGPPVAVAVRLREEARPGTLLLSAATYALLQAELPEVRGPHLLQGSGRVEYYEMRHDEVRRVSRDGSPERLPVLVPGVMLARFRIVSKLGAGGMGIVYLAHDTRLGRPVAIKILAPELQGDLQRKERFLREARAASALNHPNIAHIYEIDEADGVTFIVMEYVEGRSLDRRIDGQPLQNQELLDIGLQIVEGVEAAHSSAVVHRDLKPQNMIVNSRGQLKILDFGLAKMTALDADEGAYQSTLFRTEEGVVLGTVHYMSPEQALGRSVDLRTDIFSTGVVLYEMCTGRLPFSGATRSETVALLLHAEPPRLSRLNPAAPRELERVVHKCLEKPADARYQSAQELLGDLRILTP